MFQVPSHFYSYSFALNPDWSRKFSLQPEIAAYFRSIAEQHDGPRHITYLSAVEKAEYEDASGVWVVTIRDQKTGTLRTRRCKVLVSAVGALSVPKKCDINGASNFRGKLFHSAQWDHTFDYAGKDVVVVGMYTVLPFLSQIPLTPHRQRLQRHPIRPRHVLQPWIRQEDNPIQPTSTLASRAPKPDLLLLFQIHHALRPSRHACLPRLPILHDGIRLRRLRRKNRWWHP